MSPPSIARPLLGWYDKNRRSLPWRAKPGHTTPPYQVWLSEIMLQQTTVAAVIPYFQKFVTRWPTIEALAAAELNDVLAAWAGLGYYSRARNLHKCARYMVSEKDGIFPRHLAELRSLPGIGPYTAAAIAAIAYNEPANVVDGNVERVMARLFAVRTPLPKAKPELTALAGRLVPKKRCGDYAQALMDLGATVCTPHSPVCEACPLARYCAARKAGLERTLPARIKTKARPVKQALVFVLEDDKGRLWLRRRPESGLLGGMLEFPSTSWNIAAPRPLSEELRLLGVKNLPGAAHWTLHKLPIKHVFTHFELNLTIVRAKTKPGAKLPPGLWLKPSEAAKDALPSVMIKILRAHKKVRTVWHVG